MGYQGADWYTGATAARADIREEVERIAASAPAAEVLDTDAMAALVETWPTEGWNQTSVAGRYRLALLRGLSAGHFLRRAAGTN